MPSPETAAPFCITVGPGDLSAARSRTRRALLQWTLRRAALVFADSQDVHDEVAALGVAEGRVEIGPIGVNVDRFRPLDREAARACLGIPQDARVVVSVGRLSAYKRFPDLVEAFALAADRDENLQRVIVGGPDPGGDATSDIRAAIARTGLRGRVTLAGSRPAEEMAWWYNAADLLCMPATPASSGSVVFEAMAADCPPSSSRTGLHDVRRRDAGRGLRGNRERQQPRHGLRRMPRQRLGPTPWVRPTPQEPAKTRCARRHYPPQSLHRLL